MQAPPTDRAVGNSVPLGTLLTFASANLVPTGVTLGLQLYLPRYYASHEAIALAAVGGAFSLVRLIDIGVDPLLGVLMDHTRTRIGRYRPWLLAGIPVLMLSMYMLFMPPPNAGGLYLILWLLVFYAGTSLILLSQSAWAAALSQSYAERARIFGFIAFAGSIGSVVFLLSPLVLGAHQNSDAQVMQVMGWTMIGLLPLLGLIACLRTPEPARPAHASPRVRLIDYWRLVRRPTVTRLVMADLVFALGSGAATPIYIFFWHDARGYSLVETSVMLIVYAAAGLVGAPFWGWVGGRIGKHNGVLLGALIFTFGYLTAANVPPGHFLVILGLQFWDGFCLAIMMLIRAMLADTADEVRLEQGRERSGLLYSLVTSTQKIGGALSVSIAFALLALLGFNPAANDAAKHADGVIPVFMWAPTIFIISGALFLWRYPLTAARHKEILAALEARERTEPVVESEVQPT